MCYFCDMSKRKLCFCLGICVWAIAAFSQESVQQVRTNRSFTTNLLAFYLVADDLEDPRIAGKMLVDSNVAPDGLNLMARPILSDADFVAWNATNYTFVVTPEAALRLYNLCEHRRVGFVLMACGEAIYRGNFGTERSSIGSKEPLIYTDFIPFSMRWSSFENLFDTMDAQEPASLHKPIREDLGRAPSGFGGGANMRYKPTKEDGLRIQQLLATTNNATNNVELRIDAGIEPRYGSRPSGFLDSRDDRRIAVAVERLFGKDNH